MNFSELKKDVNNIDDLTATKYLPLAEKVIILEGTDEIQGLINSIIVEDNGLSKIDFALKEMYVTYYVLNHYANLDFNEKFTINDYDFIVENKLFQKVINKIGLDYYKFIELLDNKLEQEIEMRNSIPSTLLKISGKLIEKLDEISDPKKLAKMVKQVQKISKDNPELMEIIKGIQTKQVK